MDDELITMIMEDGSEAEFAVLESTVLGGIQYLLVTDAPGDEDGECYVLRDISDADDDLATYETVTDEAEEQAVISIFRELLKGEIDID